MLQHVSPVSHSRAIRLLLTTTEYAILGYWGVAIVHSYGLLHIPPDWLYSNHANPIVVAWNWSFLPLDLLFATTGLLARYSPRNAARLTELSLTLMFCAGLMALSFWTIQRQFDPFWWAANAWLMIIAAWAYLVRPRSRDCTSHASA
jgi:hypothetical protein